jgi:hypothetical protein
MFLEGERQIIGLSRAARRMSCRLLLAVDEVKIVTDVIRFDHKAPGDD